MTSRTTVRTVVTLVAALCVVTMFAGAASASLGILDQDSDAEVSESGGSGSGFVNASAPGQGYFNTTGVVEGNVTDQTLNITLLGEGSIADQTQTAGIDCDISASPDGSPCTPITGEDESDDGDGGEDDESTLPGIDLPFP